jgi:23S rRNA (pseudouridine1915-N3)-methyltransferase
MKITIFAIGKKHDAKLSSAIDEYTKRLSHYCPITWKLVDAKITASMNIEDIKKTETEAIMNQLKPDDKVILLDETGTLLSSVENANALQKHLNKATKHLVFIIGGAFGVTDELKQRANFVWSLSPLVFPHQLVRLILIEQLYRGFTILAGEKYHHI